MANICTVCGKLIVFDESGHSAEDICRGHNNQPDPWVTTELVSIESPDYSLVLERIAIALEDIVAKLGYISGVY